METKSPANDLKRPLPKVDVSEIVRVQKKAKGSPLKKGEFATVMDWSGKNDDEYTLLTQDGRSDRIQRGSFRIASPDELAKLKQKP